MTAARCLAVVFDLDGTLVDSLDDIAGALTGALAAASLPPPIAADVRGWIGDGARNLVERAVRAAAADADRPLIARVYEEFGARYRATPVASTRLYAGIAEALDALTAGGRVLGVLSNKPHGLTVRIADQLLAPWPFAAIAGQRPGVPLKPDPEAAHALAAELGVAAAECAMVGDSPVDVELAHAAQMRAVAVTWGYRTRAALVAARPAHLLDRPAQLLAALR